MKIINNVKKKDSIVRDMRSFSGKFSSITDLKVKIMEEFESQVPRTTHFSVGYFEGGRHSSKKWLVTPADLSAMYSTINQSGTKIDIYLWCDGASEDNSRKRKRDSSPAPPSKRVEKEREIDDMVAEIKELHENDNYSDPQYRLWARMIVNGLHSSKESPPQVPMITGIVPTRASRKSIEDTVASTVSAVVKAIASPQQSQHNSIEPQLGMGISPTKAVDIRGKCFSQLASLKKLFEESIITEDEMQEQKSSILKTLRKFS